MAEETDQYGKANRGLPNLGRKKVSTKEDLKEGKVADPSSEPVTLVETPDPNVNAAGGEDVSSDGTYANNAGDGSTTTSTTTSGRGRKSTS